MNIMILFRFMAGVALCATPVLFAMDSQSRSESFINYLALNLKLNKQSARNLYEGLERVKFVACDQAGSGSDGDDSMQNIANFIFTFGKEDCFKLPVGKQSESIQIAATALKNLCRRAKFIQGMAISRKNPI
jgi:hypothetical protein